MQNDGTENTMEGDRTFKARRAALMADFSVRDWLKRAICDLERRDAVDVVHDLELLTELFRRRLEERLRRPG